MSSKNLSKGCGIINVLVIPDVHLKPWIFDKADNVIKKNKYDKVVLLGDFVDDHDQCNNIGLYNQTFDKLLQFLTNHDCLLCWGNHDMSYVFGKHETGYSYMARLTVLDRIREVTKLLNGTYYEPAEYEKAAYIHRIDNVVFSHGGLTISFVNDFIDSIAEENNKSKQDVNIDDIIRAINHMGSTYMWENNSPLWARPSYSNYNIIYTDNVCKFQVLGHTPVYQLYTTPKFVVCDSFSTDPKNKPIGTQEFLTINTETLEYKIVS